ncbi:MAG TPA: Hsp70 family protein [Polyangiaceae bacterium]|jgi:molecular chaperone DnaK (HSP70)|nr:Hsp70 family protein [Polyangiaceae bacterium]
MSKILGIDLGTTNRVAAIVVGRESKAVVNEEGALITPGVAAWDDNGPVLVGQIAHVFLKLKKAAEDIGNVIIDWIVAEFRKTVGPRGPVHLEIRLSRSKLDQMMAPDPLPERTIVPVRKTLADGRQIIENIMEVVLVGASTRVPLVKKKVKKLFGK